MGWASGSELCGEVIQAAKAAIPDAEARWVFYKAIVRAFERYDCDTLRECDDLDKVFAAARKRRRPK